MSFCYLGDKLFSAVFAILQTQKSSERRGKSNIKCHRSLINAVLHRHYYEKVISGWRSANRKVISIVIWNNSANLLLQQRELKEKKRQRDDIKSAFKETLILGRIYTRSNIVRSQLTNIKSC
jgi:hypothetical protein